MRKKIVNKKEINEIQYASYEAEEVILKIQNKLEKLNDLSYRGMRVVI